MNKEPIILERTYDASSDIIWKALTDQQEMKKWYFDIADFKAVPGHQFEFTAVGDDGKTPYVHLCEIKEVIEGKKLSYSWRYKGYEGDSLLTFELFEEGDKTRLKLTHAGLETFPALENKAFAKENFVGGWTYFINQGLPAYLEKEMAV